MTTSKTTAPWNAWSGACADGGSMADSGASGWPWEWLALAMLPAAAALLTLSALLERSGPIRLRHWAEEAGGSLASLYGHPARFEVFRFCLGLLARVGLAVLLLALINTLLPLGLAAAEGLGLAVVALLAAGSEFLNRVVVAHDPERALRRLTKLYRLVCALLLPAVVVLAPLVPEARLRRRVEGDDEEATEEEIEAFISVGESEGILEPEERDMVRGVVDFGETAVRSVMTPRTDVVSAPCDATLDTLADHFVDSKYSRLPLYRDSPDQIVGILHMRDLLAALRGAVPVEPMSLARPPYMVPETILLGELLPELQSRGEEMAIVLDEHGGTAGLVTIEDLLEEIVGEITDEADDELPEREALPEGGWRLAGSAHVEVLDELFGVDVGDAPYETLGGLVMTALGAAPRGGEVVEALGLRFTIEAVDRRRVGRLRVERARGQRPEAPPADA
jgi:putative hemolysin